MNDRHGGEERPERLRRPPAVLTIVAVVLASLAIHL